MGFIDDEIKEGDMVIDRLERKEMHYIMKDCRRQASVPQLWELIKIFQDEIMIRQGDVDAGRVEDECNEDNE